MFLWLFQRITAILLVVLLGLHLWFSNFDLNWPSFYRALVDISLLGLALFHGLNGVRAVALDFGVGIHAHRFLSVSLVMLGIVAFLLGIYGFLPLLLAT